MIPPCVVETSGTAIYNRSMNDCPVTCTASSPHGEMEIFNLRSTAEMTQVVKKITK